MAATFHAFMFYAPDEFQAMKQEDWERFRIRDDEIDEFGFKF